MEWYVAVPFAFAMVYTIIMYSMAFIIALVLSSKTGEDVEKKREEVRKCIMYPFMVWVMAFLWWGFVCVVEMLMGVNV